MTNREKKEYLIRYRELGASVERKYEELERLRSLAGRVTSTLSHLPKGDGLQDRMADTVGQITGMEEELDAAIRDYVGRLLSELLDIPAELLLDPDEGLSPAELAEILEAFWKVNDMSDFFGIVRRLAGRRPAGPADAGGSSSGLPSPGKSASPKGS